MNVFVAAAFKALGGAPCPIKVLITSDEEIASPSSRPIIEREGRASRAVYNSEPGRPSGNVRRAARAASSCASTSMARRLIPAAISPAASVPSENCSQDRSDPCPDRSRARHHAECRPRLGRSVREHHAPHAEGQIDLRYIDPADRASTLAAIQRIIDTPTSRARRRSWRSRASSPGGADAGGQGHLHRLPGARARCGPRQPRRRVLRRLRRFRLHRERRHADHLRRRPVGGNAHTVEEYLEIDSIVPRAQALALAILRTRVD